MHIVGVSSCELLLLKAGNITTWRYRRAPVVFLIDDPALAIILKRLTQEPEAVADV
jgi:hypothetical protein